MQQKRAESQKEQWDLGVLGQYGVVWSDTGIWWGRETQCGAQD